MAGIDDVARRAGVSTATVSRALSGRGHVSAATRERVLQAARELDYVVSSSASSLASGRTRNIGVIVPHLDRWFFSTVLSGASAALSRHGYDITLYNITDDAAVRRAIFETYLRRGRVDGIIAVSIRLDERETTDLVDLGIPVVVIGGPNPVLPTLSADEHAIAQLATEHLIALGHRDIAHIGAQPEYDLDYRVPSQRRRGVEESLAAVGVTLAGHRFAPADFTIDGGYRAAQQLLEDLRSRPTAIFAASDEMAIGALLAARDLGLSVPADLSVVGVDGHELADFFGLTTVTQNPLHQGERAAVDLLRTLGEPIPEPAEREPAGLVPVELLIRRTTAPPR